MPNATVLDAFVIEFGWDPKNLTSSQSQILDGFRKLSEQGKKRADEIEKQTENALESLDKLARAALGVFAAVTGGREIKSFVQTVTDVNAGLGRTARIIDANAQVLATWRGAVRLVGGTAEGFTNSVMNMVNDFQSFAVTGQSTILPYMRALGIQVTDTHGHMRAFDQILLDIADRLHKMDPARAAFLARQMGFDQGTINLLLQGRQAIQGMLAQVKDLAPTPQDIKSAQELQAAFSKLDQSSTRLGTTILTAWAPALNKLSDALLKLSGWLQAHPETLNAIADGLLAIGSAITIGLASSGIGVAVKGLQAIFTLLGGGVLLRSLGLVAPAMEAAGVATEGFGVSLVALSGPIGWIALALGALVLVGYEFAKHWDEIWGHVSNVAKGPKFQKDFWRGMLQKNDPARGLIDIPSNPDLLGLVRSLESSGDSAISPAGAIGRYQIMPGTARQYGFDPDQLTNPAYNTLVASAVLADLNKRYHGDLAAMMVAYNAGPGVADRWIKSGRNYAMLPRETRKYLAHEAMLTRATTVGQLGARSSAIMGGGVDQSREVNIENLIVHSRATDAGGIARDINRKIEQVSMTMSANGGPQ